MSVSPESGAEPVQLTSGLAEELARAAGFARAGVLALPLRGADEAERRFAAWVEAGYAGSMGYMAQRNEDGEWKRARLERTLPWARSAVVCWMPYHCVGQSSQECSKGETGLIARYARTSKPAEQGEGRAPSDYHKVLLKRLKSVEAGLHERLGAFEVRSFVDTTPYSERELAAEAGLGWVGKNGCLIVPGMGSFGFLAVLFTGLECEAPPRIEARPMHFETTRWLVEWCRERDRRMGLQPRERNPILVPNRCGSCTRCIEACPTGAIAAPGVVDARRCVSYLTIEHRGPIEPALMAQMGNRIFGCDDCQLVCPWHPAGGNALSVAARKEIDPELTERPELVASELAWLGALTEAEFEKQFNGSPVRRAGYAGLLRNVAIAMGSSNDAQYVERLQQWAKAQDEGLRSAAEWALGRLENS